MSMKERNMIGVIWNTGYNKWSSYANSNIFNFMISQISYYEFDNPCFSNDLLYALYYLKIYKMSLAHLTIPSYLRQTSILEVLIVVDVVQI